MRAANPSKARELLAATWNNDAAEERALWVGCLLDGLSADDETFLETCLDDRSSRVREAAADLLARLPNSSLVNRMVERVASLISFESGAAGSLLKLKRSTKPHFNVTLPEAFDKTMQRDGIIEKPPEALGPKQWWLLQLISYVPLDYWTQTFGAPAATLVDAAPADYREVFVKGWLAALARRPVVDWIEPLIAAAGSQVELDSVILTAIPSPHRAKVLTAILGGPAREAISLAQLIEAWRPLDETVSQLLLKGYDLNMIMGVDAYFYLHPRSFDRIEALLTKSSDDSPYRRRVDHVLSVIALRRELHKEFAR
jgi:hypothetical protein